MTKKFDAKAMAKAQVKEALMKLFSEYEIVDMAEAQLEGFTKDTLIIRNINVDGTEIDVQVKMITPSAKTGNHYNLESDD